MEHDDIRQLTAGYALDALAPEDERSFEQHLARCEECRSDLAGFHEVAAALAHGAEAPPPPPRLRERILSRARSERPPRVVGVRRPRWAFPALGFAAAAAAAAVALGLWGLSVSRALDVERGALDRSEEALALLAQPGSQRIPLDGAQGALVVAPSGDAALLVRGLAPAPEGKTYEAWVIQDGEAVPAGLFPGGDSHTVIWLAHPVEEGAIVAVTLERAGGVPQPENDPLFASAEAA